MTSVVRHVQSPANAQPLFPSQRAALRVAKLQPGKPAVLKMPGLNSDNENSAIMLSYQARLVRGSATASLAIAEAH